MRSLLTDEILPDLEMKINNLLLTSFFPGCERRLVDDSHQRRLDIVGISSEPDDLLQQSSKFIACILADIYVRKEFLFCNQLILFNGF